VAGAKRKLWDARLDRLEAALEKQRNTRKATDKEHER
jgi:hypothetical protein